MVRRSARLAQAAEAAKEEPTSVEIDIPKPKRVKQRKRAVTVEHEPVMLSAAQRTFNVVEIRELIVRTAFEAKIDMKALRAVSRAFKASTDACMLETVDHRFFHNFNYGAAGILGVDAVLAGSPTTFEHIKRAHIDGFGSMSPRTAQILSFTSNLTELTCGDLESLAVLHSKSRFQLPKLKKGSFTFVKPPSTVYAHGHMRNLILSLTSLTTLAVHLAPADYWPYTGALKLTHYGLPKMLEGLTATVTDFTLDVRGVQTFPIKQLELVILHFPAVTALRLLLGHNIVFPNFVDILPNRLEVFDLSCGSLMIQAVLNALGKESFLPHLCRLPNLSEYREGTYGPVRKGSMAEEVVKRAVAALNKRDTIKDLVKEANVFKHLVISENGGNPEQDMEPMSEDDQFYFAQNYQSLLL